MVAAAIAGEDPALIEPLMESLDHDLLPRDGDAAARVRRPPALASTRRSSARCASGSAARSWRPDDRGDRLDRHRRPAAGVWDVIMDPRRFDDWVTIHRKLGRVDDGELRQGFRVEQTLCLHHASFKVKWPLAELEAPHARGLGGPRARPAPTPASSTTSPRSTAASGRASTTSTSTRNPAASSAASPAGCSSRGTAEREARRSLQRLKAFLERN